MKKLFLLSVFALCSLALSAQHKKGKNKNSDASANSNSDIPMQVYKQAIKYGDVSVAVNSLYILIAQHPDDISYKDSLARIYFQVGSYHQCLRVCDDLINKKPDDTTTLRMMAMSHQSLGNIKEAIADYDKVIKLTGNVYDVYQKAALEYRIKRMQESKISIEIVIAKATDNNKIILYSDKDTKQEVPLRAAAYNLYGMIAKEFNDTASAHFLFNQALELSPDFYFAIANLKALNEFAIKNPDTSAPANENMPSPKDKRK
jgi:tetratricopeptide (TPR) repeat protein